MNPTIKIQGVEVTISNITKYDLETQSQLKKATQKTVKVIRDSMRAAAPVGKTRNLKLSIKAKYFDNGMSATVVPRRPKGSHRHLVAYGTGKRKNKKGANRGNMPANPSFANSEKAKEGYYESLVKEIVGRHETV